MAEEIDYTLYKDKPATALQERFPDWLKDKVGYDPAIAKTKEAAFREGVRLAVSLRIPFQASPENRAATEELRAQREEELAAARAEREEARAAKEAERQEAAAARAAAAEEKAQQKAAKKAAPVVAQDSAATEAPAQATRPAAKKTTAKKATARTAAF